MRVVMDIGIRKVEVMDRWEALPPGGSQITGYESAVQTLGQARGDIVVMSDLRAFLTRHAAGGGQGLFSDDETVIRAISKKVSSGDLVMLTRSGQLLNKLPKARPAPPPSSQTRGAPKTTPRPGASTAAPEPNAMSDLDAANQAATLEGAAEDGVPFCEECEKARKEDEADRQGELEKIETEEAAA